MSRLLLCLACCSVLAFASGCLRRPYDGAVRFPLTGAVTVNGEPMDGGSISFIPQSEAARVSGGPVVQGRYEVDVNKGANAGTYTVRFNWQKPTGKKRYDPDTMDMVSEFKEALPAKFNTDSTYTVEVRADQTQFDFDLQL